MKVHRHLRAAGFCVVALALILDTNGVAFPEAATPRTVIGDLSHLTFTATGDLPVTFVEPVRDQAELVPSALVVVSTVKDAGVELRINGAVVSSKQLGKRTVNIKTGETRYYFYGVPLHAGPNALTAIPLGAAGLRGKPVAETVYGPGVPASLQAEFATQPVADGVTPAALLVTMHDRWDHAIVAGNHLTVRLLSGDARIADAPNAPKGAETPAPDVSPAPDAVGKTFDAPTTPGGFQRIEIVPGLVAGPLEVDVRVGDIDVRKTFYIAPYVRPAFVNGLVSIGAGSMPGSVDGDGIDDNGGARRGRVAIYGSGKVAAGTLLTLAYESQNRLSPVSSFGPYVENPNERPYLTYGDTSQLSSPTHSGDHLFLRLDRGRSTAMWGQFDADVGMTDVGAYKQLLSGANASLALGRNDRMHLGAFTARNDVAFVQQTLPISGLASLTQPLHPDIVVGSDYLQVVALDRRSGAVVSSTPLIRNVDYTIDYATGFLRFINVPLPFDPNFNPQVINVQYQYQGPGVQSRTTGGSLAIKLGNDGKTKLQFGFVDDASGAQNYSLFSQALARAWSNGSWSIGRAASKGIVPTAAIAGLLPGSGSGDAVSARLNIHSAATTADVSYAKTTGGYSDPFGGISTPGLMTYAVRVARRIVEKASLEIGYSGQANTFNGADQEQRDASLQYHWHPSHIWSYVVGLMEHQQRIGSGVPVPVPLPSGAPSPVPPANGTQTQAHAGIQYVPNQRVALNLEQYLTLSGSDVGSSQPTQTSAQLTYAIAKKGSVFLRELWSSQPAASFAGSTQTFANGTSSTHTTEIGIQNALSPNTTVSSSYVVNGTGSGANIYSTMGVQQKIALSKDFGGNVFLQKADTTGQGGQGFTVWGTSLSYANEKKMRAAVAFQSRSGASGGSTLNASVGGHLTPGWSIVGTVQRAYGNGQFAANDRMSLAYRSPQSDRFTSLANYTRANGSDATNGPGIGSVLSFQELYRPWNGFELGGTFAYKLDGDGEYLAHTSFYGAYARQNIGRRFDVGVEVQHVAIPADARSASTNLATELGYQLGNSARVSAGYNFSGGVDPALIGQPTRHGFYVTVTTLLDRIFGWGKP